jgi:dihydrofolate reductase
MAKLIYAAIMSLDGYIADENGNFDWAEPDAEVHAFVNDLERQVGTYLYGRRMYETMAVWQTLDTGDDQESVWRDYADIWRSADKIVYSRTLDRVSTPRTQLERTFEPDAVRLMKRSAARDMAIGGSDLAAQAIRAGLVDAYQLFLVPIIIGSGKQALPDGFRQTLELLDERRFGGGMIYLHYSFQRRNELRR